MDIFHTNPIFVAGIVTINKNVKNIEKLLNGSSPHHISAGLLRGAVRHDEVEAKVHLRCHGQPLQEH